MPVVTSPESKSSPDPAVRQLRATFCPEVTPKQLGQQLCSYYTPGPRGTERRADGAAVGFWAPLTPRQSCSRTGRAGRSPWQIQRQPGPPSPPRPTARNSRRAPERSRAGAAGQDTALLAPRAAGALASPAARLLGRAPLPRHYSRSVGERSLPAALCPASGTSRRPRSAASGTPRGPPRGGEKPCLGLQQ